MGALLYSNETYTQTLPIIDASGLPSQPFSYTFKGWLFDWTTGAVVESPASPDQLYPLIQADVERYINFWETEFAPNLTTIGYKACTTVLQDLVRYATNSYLQNGIPAELTVPFSQWLTQNGYDPVILPGIFETGLC